ncbi:hypothetical protein E8E13_003566 [Curvularia kusanoi]|uniref:Uncharacterized protein n=1 Tax=Curvularia kusanoi TaxID=90978 RepID=A0A9P4T815_CURKU|nr:hypothetical protein E8E13_003566 [Curvularia kusanoi]
MDSLTHTLIAPLTTIHISITKTITTTPTPASTVAAPLLITPTSLLPLPTTIPTATATPNPQSPTPTIALLTLIFVIVLALILLLATCHYLLHFLRTRTPDFKALQAELAKYKSGSVGKGITDLYRARMNAVDLEAGGSAFDVQAALYRARTRGSAVEGDAVEGRGSWAENADRESETTVVMDASSGGSSKASSSVTEFFPHENARPESRFRPDSGLRSLAALGEVAVQELGEFPKTHSEYLEQVVAPREEERKRQLKFAENATIGRYLDIASDRRNRESVQEVALNRANEIIKGQLERGEEVGVEGEGEVKVLADRVEVRERMTERFSVKSEQAEFCDVDLD